MRSTDRPVASVRLVSRATRLVELLGPLPPGSRRPELLYDSPASQAAHLTAPRKVGACIGTGERQAKFLVDKTADGDALLDALARHPAAPSRLARPYGVRGYLVEAP